MSFRIAWDFPALTAFYDVPWPTSAALDAAVHRFAAGRATLLESGAYVISKAGYRIRVRVDQNAGTVLVLYMERF